MTTFSASIEISAAPEKIWAIITDTPSHPSFDPNCIRIQGGKAGEGVWLRIYEAGGPERGYLMRVVSFSPPRIMIWFGGSRFALLRRTRTFTIEERSRTNCLFILKEEFSGPMLRLSRRSIPDMTEAFEDFCRGLKELAEA